MPSFNSSHFIFIVFCLFLINHRSEIIDLPVQGKIFFLISFFFFFISHMRKIIKKLIFFLYYEYFCCNILRVNFFFFLSSSILFYFIYIFSHYLFSDINHFYYFKFPNDTFSLQFRCNITMLSIIYFDKLNQTKHPSFDNNFFIYKYIIPSSSCFSKNNE